MSQVKVRAALEQRLKTFATANGFKVAWENRSDEYAENYLRPTLFAAPTDNPSLGVEHRRYKGFLRVLVNYYGLDTGTVALETKAEALANYFPRGLMIPYSGVVVNIQGTPSISSVDIDGMFCYVAVEIPYFCDTY